VVVTITRVVALHATQEGAECVPVVEHEIAHAQERQLLQPPCRKANTAGAAAGRWWTMHVSSRFKCCLPAICVDVCRTVH
jgi:hypothetical protein